MKKKYIRILSVFLALITTFSSLAITAYALSWDGSSAGGGGAGTSARTERIRHYDNRRQLYARLPFQRRR